MVSELPLVWAIEDYDFPYPCLSNSNMSMGLVALLYWFHPACAVTLFAQRVPCYREQRLPAPPRGTPTTMKKQDSTLLIEGIYIEQHQGQAKDQG